MDDTIDTPAPAAISRKALFSAFLLMGLVSFGGVLPWARRILVEQRRWLTDTEFVELLSLGQVLPGPNVVNLSIMFGRRLHGPAGALLAFSGLMLAPLIIILLLAMVYSQYGHIAAVQRAVGATAAATAGLLVATGVKMAMAQPRSWRAAGICLLTLICAGVLGLPLIAVLLALGPLSIALVWSASK